MSTENLTIRIASDKKKEMKNSALKAGITLTAYIISLHNADIRREKSFLMEKPYTWTDREV